MGAEASLQAAPAERDAASSASRCSRLAPQAPKAKDSPADMAIVVPATMPMVTPLPLGGGMGAGYTVAGMPLGWTTVVWWMTCGGAAYRGCV